MATLRAIPPLEGDGGQRSRTLLGAIMAVLFWQRRGASVHPDDEEVIRTHPEYRSVASRIIDQILEVASEVSTPRSIIRDIAPHVVISNYSAISRLPPP